MRIVFLVSLMVLSNFAFAGVYKCVDGNGKKVYQNKPCTDIENATEFDPVSGANNKVIDNEQLLLLEQQKIQQQQQEEQRKLQEQQQKQQQLEQDILTESQKNQEWIKSHPGKYSAFAIPPYANNKHPPFADSFAQRLPEVERYRRFAAEIALASGKCGRVESAELNLRSTSTRLVFLIDCSSSESFLLDEKQILEVNP